MTHLSEVELNYWREQYKQRARAIGDRTVDYAHECAIEYAETHAANMHPSIKHGIVAAYMRYVIEADHGERVLLRVSIDRLLSLGKALHGYQATT